MILVLTNESDAHADYLVPRLEARGARIIRFNPKWFPKRACMSLRIDAEGLRRQLVLDGELIDLNQVAAIWYRRPDPPDPQPGLVAAEDEGSLVADCQDFVDDFWNALECTIVPGPRYTLRIAQQKILQLAIAHDIGFMLPPSLVGTDPDSFIDFFNKYNGSLIHKVVGFTGIRWPTIQAQFASFTERLQRRNVTYAHALRYCPVTFQAYVEKCIELRITVVGRNVFAAEIHSQATRQTKHDFRHYDHLHTPHRSHILSKDVERRCVELVDRLGLNYGAIDMILTPDGHYVFLEINPNGQYLWIEDQTGLPITEALCDLLLSGDRQRPVPQH